MSVRLSFCPLALFALTIAVPVRAETAASMPDFSGWWNHSSLNGLEQPVSGPGPLRNRSRLRTGPQAGVGNVSELVGDYTNPILQPWAADVVKKFGEIPWPAKSTRPRVTSVGLNRCPPFS